ncbi:MAG: membrane protein insertion efficiency factor YidD [Bacteroidales bacterium]|nr:membrane protein insertion efficiency factor YidD [Bacteroidales bacterium]
MNNEAIIADYYRRYHPLSRPKTTWTAFFIRVATVLLAALFVTTAILIVLYAYKVIEWGSFPLNYFLRIYLFVTCFICLLLHKQILITLIELYQHYAPERTRRKCVCMPSCSVYATMALKKYNTFKALRLIAHRLSICCGTICFIDYP